LETKKSLDSYGSLMFIFQEKKLVAHMQHMEQQVI
jgi:hypothetical protein